MKDDTAHDVLNAMDALLEQERSALLEGDLDGLGEMHGRKEALMDKLGHIEVAAADAQLQGVQEKLERNQALLDSALAGIRSVARRLAMVRRVRQSLEYYDEDGAKASVDIGVERSVEKRA